MKFMEWTDSAKQKTINQKNRKTTKANQWRGAIEKRGGEGIATKMRDTERKGIGS